jgi:hypothetical protein
VQAAKLQVDTRRWLASKLLPERFGERAALELTGAGGKDLIPENQTDPARLAAAILHVLREPRAEGVGAGCPVHNRPPLSNALCWVV